MLRFEMLRFEILRFEILRFAQDDKNERRFEIASY